MVEAQAADLVGFATGGPSPARTNKRMSTRSASMRKISTSGSEDSLSLDPAPPAKKPRLKLNVKPRKVSDGMSDTIAVSRPKRGSGARVRYSQDAIYHEESEVVKAAGSPTPSSGLSSLSSTPPPKTGDREESPFKDPTPALATREEYGDFMSYYITGGDEEQPETKPKRGRPKSKPKVDSPKQPKQPKPTKQSKPVKGSRKASHASPSPAQPVPQAVTQTAYEPLPLPPQAAKPVPQQQQGLPPPLPAQQYPVNGQMNRLQGRPPAQSNFQSHRPTSIHNGPPPPIIQYMDIQADPKPTQPDTITIMIRKLEALSAALTNFGGIPSIPPTPPLPPVEKPKTVIVPAGDNPLDNFLSHFGGEDDDESEDRNFDYVLSNPGAPDGPLCYGVQFIQNALKSWAQQRTTHQVTQQWQAQQAQVQHQIRRGPGRPKRYDDSEHHVQPVIHMDLGATPEGIAIKAFQSVLDSGCLQVNGVLPIELSRALRHLYMQIDHLINQGTKHELNWQCMSYGAQIAAHKARLDKFKEAKAQEDMQVQQRIVHERAMIAQMEEVGIPNGQMPELSGLQPRPQHIMDFERRQSQQHSVQASNNAPQLQSMQAASQSPAAPASNAPLQATAEFADHIMAHNGTFSSPSAPYMPNGAKTQLSYAQSGSGLRQAPSAFNKGSAAGVHLDKMKLYMPGFLPRSGQSMKFSFAPHNEAAVRVFGTGAFPTNEHGPNIPNRGPMSATPTQPSLNGSTPDRLSSAPFQTPGNAMSPIDLDPDSPAEATIGDDTSNDKPANPTMGSPVPVTAGFTPVNATALAAVGERQSSVPAASPGNMSAETIKVAKRRPSRVASASNSPATGFRAVNKPVASGFPHAGAIVVDP